MYLGLKKFNSKKYNSDRGIQEIKLKIRGQSQNYFG
jgi:hypothetical protein